MYNPVMSLLNKLHDGGYMVIMHDRRVIWSLIDLNGMQPDNIITDEGEALIRAQYQVLVSDIAAP